MQVTVPPGEMALREMLMRFESEGHCFGFAASLVHIKVALAAPKNEACTAPRHKPLII